MALAEYETLFRYLHILAGITWIGLLYFFNLVNAPLLKLKLSKPYDVDMAEKATPNITLKTLFWFRWAAMFTFLFGLLLVGARGEVLGMGDYFFARGWPGYFILVGVILGFTMWFNVWFLIWPKQQTILSNNKAMADAPEDRKAAMQAENAASVKVAVNASRYNTWASIPMLFGMVFGSIHGEGVNDITTIGSYGVALLVMVVVLLLMVFYSNRKL